MEQYYITTKSGKQLGPLTLNGNMYVSPEEITADGMSREELEHVTIREIREDGSATETEMRNAVCDGILHWTEGWLFNLREMSEIEQLRAENEMLTECVLEMSEIVYGA